MPNLQNKFIIFIHIQKTGGITLQRILRRQLGPSLFSRTVHIKTSKKQPTTLKAAMQVKQQKDRFFVAHCCFGVHRHLPQPFTYMTMIRHPVSRIVSLYYFSKENSTAYYQKHAYNRSLEDFALNTPLMELDNGQVRFLAGDDDDLFINRTPIGACTNSLLEQAKFNLEQYFSYVGLTEKFDQSVLLLAKVIQKKHFLYLRRNIANKSERPVISNSLCQRIEERNILDIKLHEHVQKRFNQDCSLYGLDDKEFLQTFKSQNEIYNTLFSGPYAIYDTFKAVLQNQLGRP